MTPATIRGALEAARAWIDERRGIAEIVDAIPLIDAALASIPSSPYDQAIQALAAAGMADGYTWQYMNSQCWSDTPFGRGCHAVRILNCFDVPKCLDGEGEPSLRRIVSGAVVEAP